MSDATCAICATGLPVPVICTSCTAKIRRDLDTVGRLRAQLDPTPGRTGSAGRASGKPGSRPPANLTIIAMADIRSRFRLTDDGEADPDNVTNVDADLLTEARLVIEARRLNPPMRDVSDSLRILNIHLDWICSSDRVDEFAAVLAGCAQALRSVLRDWPDPAIGKCPDIDPRGESDTCGGPLRWHDGSVAVICGRCGSRWRSDDLVNVGRVSPLNLWESVPHVAAMLDMSERTLRHWVMGGRVKRNSLGHVRHADVWRILAEKNDPQQR